MVKNTVCKETYKVGFHGKVAIGKRQKLVPRAVDVCHLKIR